MKRKFRILLIDDDEFIRMLVRDIFWIHGRGKYQVEEARTVDEGEKLLKEKKIDLILLDLIFPENGKKAESSLSFLEKIKSDPETKDTKVIVFSGYPDLKNKTLELGAEKFLLKGEYLPKEIFEAAENIIGT